MNQHYWLTFCQWSVLYDVKYVLTILTNYAHALWLYMSGILR